MAKNSKRYEDFDLHELTEHLTNSITDRIYREYRPDLKKIFLANREHDQTPENDLDVADETIKRIKEQLEAKVADKITDSIAMQMVRDAEEQFHPSEDWEKNVDAWLKRIRYVAIAYLFPVVVSMVGIFFLVMLESYKVLVYVNQYYSDIASGAATAGAKVGLNLAVSAILSVLDLILIGSLVVMVLIGGFENTVSRIGMTHGVPTWFGKLDVGQLKIKVAASIVIISSIHLLMGFMKIDFNAPESDPSNTMNAEALYWTAIIHGVFVLSALVLTAMEWINHKVK